MSTPQTWLVTGTSRGIGFSIVQQLLRSPHNVVFAVCKDPSSASAAAVSILQTASGTLGKLHIVEMDVTDEASVSRAMRKVESILGDAGLDYLINGNAGIASRDTPSTLVPKYLTTTMKEIVGGPILVTRTFMPLLEQGNRKVIANISSSLGSIGIDYGVNHSSYSISKAALNMLTYKQAKEWPNLITFVLDPGWVDIDMATTRTALERQESAAGIVNVVSNANQSYAGSFFNYQGKRMPW